MAQAYLRQSIEDMMAALGVFEIQLLNTWSVCGEKNITEKSNALLPLTPKTCNYAICEEVTNLQGRSSNNFVWYLKKVLELLLVFSYLNFSSVICLLGNKICKFAYFPNKPNLQLGWNDILNSFGGL